MKPTWRKSTRSGTGQGGGANCVELADLTATIGIRDSKDPLGGHQSLSRAAFAGLVERIKNNDLDLPSL